MFTPDDDMDQLEHEIAVAERAVEKHHLTPMYLIEDEDAYIAKGIRLEQRLADLEWARRERVAQLIAQAEGFSA